MSTPKTLLITGATGKQGGAVVDALLALPDVEKTFLVLAVTRDASSASAKRLAARSSAVKLVQGNLADVPALFSAAVDSAQGPIWGVYSVQISMGKGVTVESEIAQGTAMIDESIRYGVTHFVYSSVERGGDDASWDNPTPIPHFQSKQKIEAHLREKAGVNGEWMGWTVLRPVAFMDNLAPGFPSRVFLTALRDTLKGKTLQWVATADIGVFAAKAFAEPAKWNARAVGLAGDELDFDGISAAFDKATGAPMYPTWSFLGRTLMYMVAEMGTMVTWFATDGYRAAVRSCREENKGMLDLEAWIREKSAFVAK
ncbi:NAD(P)-binding protein [Saccharata proteae CBS 121410]|uniref:NAD(P)-binding protein n=1 Tax=Saccharata proteae CBS 121410 TaxID=1314787 RepID=A0A9P4LTY3_9PEZI|nr:NAD(P)-binding protein [Saccharata proteae CBS 121410]